jgi:polysaccharide export outer membrane protein
MPKLNIPTGQTILRTVLLCAVSGLYAAAQAPVIPLTATPVTATPGKDDNSAAIGAQSAAAAAAAAVPHAPEHVASYVLGAEDQVVIRAFQAPELSEKPIQIAGDGYVNLPLVGRVKAAGESVSAFENDLSERLKYYVKDPQVSVFVAEYRSQPVSVVGSVNTPGVVQLRGRKNLVEVIALAGGLRAEAGNTVTITRELTEGKIPVQGAKDDPKGLYSTATINLHDVMDAKTPQENVLIKANDVIMIAKAKMLYVVGEVNKPGAYVLTEKDSLSVIQAVALAGGFTPLAKAKKAKILYQYSGQMASNSQATTDVQKIMQGNAPDIALHGDDVLFIPSSAAKSAGAKALQTAMNMAGAAVFRF